MNVVEPPPSQSGDDLEGLLRAFLRSQLPQPWPPPRILSVVNSCQRWPATGRNLIRSRWTLAASVALLFFGSWLLPSRFTSDAKPEHGASGAMIGSDDIRRDFHKGRKQRMGGNTNKPGLAADKGDQFPELEESDLPELK